MNIPINEDCAKQGIPEDAEMPNGEEAIRVPVAKTMTDYLWDRYNLAMYSFVNGFLRRGELGRITGCRVLNKKWFNRETLHRSKRVDYWKVDRNSFYADVPVTLDLTTPFGLVQWKGYICFWCEFNQEFDCELVDLTAKPERNGYDTLNKFLVPVYDNKKIDYLAQKMWEDFGIPKGMTDPEARNPFLLAHRMGFRIFYCKFHERGKVSSVFFFGNGEMEVDGDVWEVDENGKKALIKKFDRTPFHVPEGSILVNENIICFKYLSMKIYHECIHGQWHYLYSRLQALTNNDPTNLETKLVKKEDYKTSDDPLYFMEKQAKRGAFGLDMPRDATLRLIEDGERRIRDFKNGGDRYEKIGAEIMRAYKEPDFFVRARMIQLGRVQAYGSFNWADKKRIEAYGFSATAFEDYIADDEEVITYRVDHCDVNRISKENENLRKLIENRTYIYVPGHVVFNDARFVHYVNGEWKLTDLAAKAVDECCIRFVQVYVQEYPGRFVFDRMYYDAEYYAQTKLYLNAFYDELEKHPESHGVKREDIHDDFDAKDSYGKDYPMDFYEGIKQLLKFNKISLSKMAEDFDMSDDTLKRRLQNPRDYKDVDFLTEICLYFKLPDWHSRLIFKRAKVQLDEDNKRDKIIQDILRGRSCDGIDAANEILQKYGEVKLGTMAS